MTLSELWGIGQNLLIWEWVKLSEFPSTYSYDEALLLSPLIEDWWLVWIPDHGEAVVKVEEVRKRIV
ncbi:hypothetical protein IJ00_13055 [Calothrix sp. 336/3]|nr:hypothetical protein IJ00_13055 [Calothrix sp. 336/3]